MKRIVSMALLLLFCFNMNSINVKADSLTLSARSAVLMDAATGEILFEKDADTPRAMASTTKLMTALVAAECGDWSQTITVTAEMVAVEGSSLGLRAGDTLTLWDAVCGMLLTSGNDAANAVALTLADSFAAFAALMNSKAAILGMSSTTFVTPSGLDAAEHLSTARDMAQLGKAVLQDPVLAKIVGMERATIVISGREVTVKNHNRLLSLFADAIGMKTGFTKKAGRCLVSAATRDGMTLVAVTLDAPDDWNDHIALFEYGFSGWKTLELPVVTLPSLPIVGGVSSDIALHSDAPLPVTVAVSETEEIEVVLRLPPFCFAPLESGALVGELEYRMHGETIGVSSVRTANAVGERPLRNGPLVWFGRYFQLLFTKLIF